MLSLVYSPVWFHGFDTVLELFSGIVAMLIAMAGYRAYKLARDKKYFYFSAAFFSITLSYAARAFTTLYFFFSGLDNVPGAGVAQSLSNPVFGNLNIFVIGRFAYVFLVLFAYMILLLLSMRPKDRRTDRRLIALLSIFVVLFSVLSYTSALAFHLVALTFLVFMTANFFNNYRANRSLSTKLIFLAFAAITVECALWLLASYNCHSIVMVSAYIARALSYVFLLSALLRVYKK